MRLIAQKYGRFGLCTNYYANYLHKRDKVFVFFIVSLQNGCLSVCKSLLSSKYCQLIINQKASDSRTALHLATIGGNLEAIFELAQGKGFDAEIGDREGR